MQVTQSPIVRLNPQHIKDSDSQSFPQGAENLFNQLSPISQNDNIFQKLNPDQQQNQFYAPKKILKKRKQQKISKKQKQSQKKHKKQKKHKHKHKKLKKEPTHNQENQSQQKNPFAQDSAESQQNSSSNQNLSQQHQSNKNSQHEKKITSQKKKSSKRRKRLQDQQGFNLAQLGNEPKSFSQQSDDSDGSFSKEKKNKSKNKVKKAKPQKKKKQIIKNEDLIHNLLQKGKFADSQDEQQSNHRQQKKYFNGMQFDRLFKNNKKSKEIKVFNKLFQDLDFDDQLKQNNDNQIKGSSNVTSQGNNNEGDQHNKNEDIDIPEFQKMDLQLKPKQSSTISQRNSFFKKMQHIKKSRGMQSKISEEEYKASNIENKKRSISKLIDGVDPMDDQEQIQVNIKIPEITKGKSSEMMNNTLFLKRSLDNSKGLLMNLNRANSVQPQKQKSEFEQQLKGSFRVLENKKNTKDRRILFMQMQQQIRKRRSKYLTQQQINISFKKTKLQQIQQDRKQIQERRRKAALLGVDSDNSELDDQQQMNKDDNNNKNDEGDLSQKSKKINNNNQDDNAKQQIIKDEMDDLLEEKNQNQNHKTNSKLKEQIIKQLRQRQCKNEKLEQENQQQYDQNQQQIFSHCQKMDVQREDEGQQQQDLIGDVILSSQKSQRNHQEQMQQEQNEIDNQSLLEENEQDKNQLSQNQQNQQKNIDIQNQEQLKIKKTLQDQGINTKRIKFVPQPIQSQSQQQQKQNTNIKISQQEEVIDEQKFAQMFPQQFTRHQFKKLRKIATVIANKKKYAEQRNKRARQYFDQQAQLGSDNEDHDDQIKKIDYKAQQKQYQGMDLDAQLQQLIDNAVNINEEDEQQAFKRYLQDVKMKDKQQLRKIIRGQFRQKKKQIDIQLDDDQRQRQSRMEKMMEEIQKRQAQDNKDLYANSQNSDQIQHEDLYDKKGNFQVCLNQDDESSEDYANYEQLAIYLDDNITAKKTIEVPHQKNDNFQKILPQSKKKQQKLKTSSKALLDSSLNNKKSICGFLSQESKVLDSLMKLKTSKKSSSSSLNQILMKNKKKVEVQKPMFLINRSFGKRN